MEEPTVEATEEHNLLPPNLLSFRGQWAFFSLAFQCVANGLRNMSDSEIAEIVGRYLKDKYPGGATLEALTQGIRHEQDWWYVPVRPSFEPPRRYEYYEALADVEGALEDMEHLTVLFLPIAPENENSSMQE